MKNAKYIRAHIEASLNRGQAALEAIKQEAATPEVRGQEKLIEEYAERIARMDQTVRVLDSLLGYIDS